MLKTVMNGFKYKKINVSVLKLLAVIFLQFEDY